MAYSSRLELVVDSRSGEKSLQRVEGRLHGVERAGDRAEGSVRGMSSSLGGLRTVALAASGALAALGINRLGADVFQTVQSTEKLRASLVTVTGSVEAANAAWDQLSEFAKTTPFALDQSVQGFIRMKSLGLDPTESAMRSFANTAAAMNTDLMQMVEAVADATVGEFERLRSYGIRASQDGDRVALTFQGITTEIGNNAREIQRYLENIGNTNFADAAIDQMDTLGGKANNLGDSIDDLYRAIGEAGATDLFNAALDGSAETVDYLTENVDTLADGVELLGDALLLTAGVLGARYVTAMAAGTASLVNKTRASIADAKAEALAAQQTTRRTAAELQSANAIRARAIADAKATAGTNAHAFAMQNLTAASTRATAAQAAHTSATNVATAAMGRASIAARGLSGAMALVGGPLGLLVGAGGLLYYFREELGLVEKPAITAAGAVDELAMRVDGASNSMLKFEVAAFTAEMVSLQTAAQQAEDNIAGLQRAQEQASGVGPGPGGPAGRDVLKRHEANLESLNNQIKAREQAVQTLTARLDELGASESETDRLTRQLTISVDGLSDAQKEAQRQAEQFADSLRSLQDQLFPVEAAQRQYRQEQMLLTTALTQGKIGIDRYLEAWGRLQDAQRSDEGWQDAYGFTGDSANEVDKLSDATSDLGLTFESAFENAIVNGEGFRDVLDGIYQDILRITVRKGISEPFVDAVSGFDWGGLFGGGGAGSFSGSPGGLYAEGGYTGPGGKYDPAGIVHAGEFVVKKSVVDNPGVRPFLEGLNRKGYAEGGYVGGGPGGGAAASPVNVYISTPPGTEARTEERQNAQGGRDLHVVIDEVTAQNLNNPGSRTGRAMQQRFGVQRTLTGRG